MVLMKLFWKEFILGGLGIRFWVGFMFDICNGWRFGWFCIVWYLVWWVMGVYKDIGWINWWDGLLSGVVWYDLGVGMVVVCGV